MQVAIELPNNFVSSRGVARIRHEFTISYALWLYQQGRVTLSNAAELAGIDLYDFMITCKLNKMPVIDISREDLIEELLGFDPR